MADLFFILSPAISNFNPSSIKIREKLAELLLTFEERRAARREARMMDKAGATADTTAAYYGASSRYVKAPDGPLIRTAGAEEMSVNRQMSR